MIYEFFGIGIIQVIGNVKHPCSICLKGVGVNSIRCTQCIQWVHARCSKVKGSLKNIEQGWPTFEARVQQKEKSKPWGLYPRNSFITMNVASIHNFMNLPLKKGFRYLTIIRETL